MELENKNKTQTDENNNPNPTVDELLKTIRELQANSVSKEEYEKAQEDNRKLVKELTENRRVVRQEDSEEPTKEDILNRCKERTKKLDKTNSSYEKVSILIDNYDDMKTLGMDTKIVDEKARGFTCYSRRE
jgi:predicted membrane chloride channel (bestrophin family)